MTINLPDLTQQGLFINPQVHLSTWEPEKWSVAPDWQQIINQFLQTSAALKLGSFMQSRLAAGASVFPAQPFRALEATPLARVRVVILGQDPYHGAGQADGLAFSVPQGTPTPPSLRNIYKEIAQHPALPRPAKPDNPNKPNKLWDHLPTSTLLPWAEQGVLLLNTCLTVELGQPGSHSKKGWEVLTDEIIKTIWASSNPVVFMLWGAHAQTKQTLFTTQVAKAALPVAQSQHLVLTANHPSPLSALRPPAPFIGCGHFGKANAFLKSQGQQPIVW